MDAGAVVVVWYTAPCGEPSPIWRIRYLACNPCRLPAPLVGARGHEHRAAQFFFFFDKHTPLFYGSDTVLTSSLPNRETANTQYGPGRDYSKVLGTALTSHHERVGYS